MTPSRVPGSHNFRFSRYVPGVGRIANSARTSKLTEFRYRDGLLTKLIKAGALDTLRLFKRGKLRIEQLITADRAGRLERSGEQLRLDTPLVEAVADWLPTSADARASRDRYEVSWRRFCRVATAEGEFPPGATVYDLVLMDFDKLRRRWGATGSDWNRARAMLSAFLSRFLGHVHHPFRHEVMGRCPRAKEVPARMPDLTPATFWQLVAAAPEWVQPAYVAMAVLGVGPKEYLALAAKDLNPDQLTVRVRGTKTEHRDRVIAVDARLWAWVTRAVPAPLAYGWLRVYWLRTCAAMGIQDLRMYDLRHLSAQYAGDRGVTDRDLTIHLGHGDPAMSHRYSRRAIARGVAKAIADALVGAEA